MKPEQLPLIAIIMACSLAAASAASVDSAPATQPAQEGIDQSSPEYKAIDEGHKSGRASLPASRFA